jgi:hypothetical protein
VGQISIPPKSTGKGHGCSATAINPRVVITARHCFCDNATVAPSLVQFTLPGMAGFIPGQRIVAHSGALDVCKVPQDSVVAAADVALVVLRDSIPPDVVSTFMKVDFDPTAFVHPLLDPQLKVFQTGFGGTEWDSSSGGGTRRTGQVVFFYPLDALPVWFPEPFKGSFYAATADADADESGENSTHARGDSGGPLWVTRPGDGALAERRLIGVTSGHYAYPGLYLTPVGSVIWYMDYRQTWAPTWNTFFSDPKNKATYSNARLILDALGDDADNDGIQDDVDNCPPVACKDDPLRCANTLQDDSDGDGYGDACDTCPKADFHLPNAPPPDWDHDGVQDACDTCPALSNRYSQDDTDGDEVGDACDNCKSANPTEPCASDADCPTTPSGGGNFCVRPVGRCAAQVDDRDNDGLGDACDDCPGNDQNGLRQLYDNSNLAAELRWNAPRLLDVCDPTPVYVSRPVSQDAWAMCPTDADPMARCLDSLPLEGMAILGTETHTKATPTKTSFKAPVGFRHCDCHVNGVELPYEACIAGRCELKKSDYFNANGNYNRVTMADEETPEATIYPSTIAAPYFASRTFTNAFESDETTLWRWRLDVDAGHVPAYPKEVPLLGVVDTTTGVFWSHALPTMNPTSPRDASFEQQLRSHHEYVQTPYVARIEPLTNLPLWPAPKGPCPIMPCGLLLRPDTARINPNPFDRSIFESFRGPMLLLADQGAPVLVDSGSKAYDAAPLLSEALSTRLLDEATQWLRPVEAGHTLRALDRTTQLVALPNDWTLGAPITELVYGPEGLVERGRTHGLAALEAADNSLQPPERRGARGIFTARTNAVYLVGGAAGAGKGEHPTGELWRYDLDGRAWERLVTATPLVKHVLAVAYDSAREQLLVLDTPEQTSFWPAPIRLLLIDTRTGASKLLGTFPRTPLFDRYSLTARGEGSYLLVASRKQIARVVMARLAITPAEKLEWTGLTTRNGKLFDEPALTDDGVVLPLVRGGKLELPTITDADFGPCQGVPHVF